MKILIEGERYPLKILAEIFDDQKFYLPDKEQGVVKAVGYYHSFVKNQLVYLLPKVFLENGRVFGKFSPVELLETDFTESVKHRREFAWIRKLVVYFYRSLAEFKKRFSGSLLTESQSSFELQTNLGRKEYSYLDLVLSFVNFYKKNKLTILFHHVEAISEQAKKPRWEKTVVKSIPLISSAESHVYPEIVNRKKIIKDEEELLQYFFSILSHFNEELQLNLTLDKSYKLIKGNAFRQLQKNGLAKLRQIKHRYFADKLKRMYQLCELYFSQTDFSSVKKRKEEFIAVSNYNIVFEDMIDKLLSDDWRQSTKLDGVSLTDLKYHPDGKIVDHLYQDKSLIDESRIFYIGDSKYYKPDSQAGKISVYKQFTYAKNVIQFNLNLFNQTEKYYSPKIRYRDELTEGYNLTPNFFIYATLEDLDDFDNDRWQEFASPQKSFHFADRLFDRDTLFVQQYRINFLYVLKFYSSQNELLLEDFRRRTKAKIRHGFLEFFNNKLKSGFEFFEKDFKPQELTEFIEKNFFKLNGKCFSINDKTLIIARFREDSKLDELLKDFRPKTLF